MSFLFSKRILLRILGVFLLWLGIKYFFPVLFPFLLGGLLALAAEPIVSFSEHALHIKRGLATAVGVTVTLLLIVGVLSLIGAVIIQELLNLANAVPDLEQTAKQGISVLENWAVTLAEKAPSGMQPVLTHTVENTFSDGSILMEQLASKAGTAITSILSGIPARFLSLGTAILSGFMISLRMPKIRYFLQNKLPPQWTQTYLPILCRMKNAVFGWLRAQGILMLMIFGIITAGFLLLQIPYGPFWALLIALLDAVPMLGTGLILLPWAGVCFLMGNTPQGIGMLGIFAAASLSRSVVEPKLLGKHLGLDPLITLFSLYAGYRFFGFLGLLVAPIFTAAIMSTWPEKP